MLLKLKTLSHWAAKIPNDMLFTGDTSETKM